MKDVLSIGLLNNALLLLVLSVIYEVAYLLPQKLEKYRDILSGIAIGVMAIVVMNMPFRFSAGIIFDTRSVLLSVAAFTLGAIPAVIAGIIALIYRALLSGDGMLTGIAVIISSVGIGIIWRRWNRIALKKRKVLNSYLMSVTVHITMLLCMFFIPYPQNIVVLKAIMLPVMVIYPISSVILTLLLEAQKDRKNIQEKLNQSHEMLDYIINHDRSAVAVHDKDMKYMYVSQSYIDSYKIKDKDIIGKNHYDVFPDLPQKWRDVHQRVLKGEVISAEDDMYIHDDGTRDWTRWECRPWYEADGSIGGLIVYTEVINKRKEMELELRRMKEYLEKLVNSGSAPVIVLDTDFNIVTFSKAAQDITGLSFEQVNGEYAGKIFQDPAVEYLKRALLEEPSGSGEHTLEVEMESVNGRKSIVLWSYTVILDESQNSISFLLQGQDITEIKEAENHLMYLSYHDQLTKLYNRRYFEKVIADMDKPENFPISIIMCDVNGLKLVNDSFGHTAGDDILIKTAEVLKLVCSYDENICISRIGGDEFAMLCPRTSSDDAKEIITRSKHLVSGIEVANVQLSISMGLDTKDEENQSIMDTLSNAENHMYRQKLYERTSMRSKTIDVVMRTLFEKSKRESQHSSRVSSICAAIAVKLDLPKDEISQIRTAGLLHDIGKIGISERILNKPDKLDETEWTEIKKHPEIGWRILSSSTEFTDLAVFVLDHHERWDGKGYPGGLEGEQIPLEARMIAIADSYDAMTSNRPYREGLTREEAMDEIRTCSGKQFDPHIADVFLNEVLPLLRNL